MAGDKVIIVSNLEAFEKIISCDQLVVVDCFATWCPPCKMLSPHFERFSTSYGDVKFVKVDVDKARDVSAKLKIKAMPTIKFYRGGNEVQEIVGADVQGIEKAIQNLK